MSLTKLGPNIDNAGGRSELPVVDNSANAFSFMVLKQLEIMNSYLSIMTDTKIDLGDIE